MKASDVMSTAVVTVQSNASLREVNQLMHKYHLDYLLVVSGDGKLEGILTYSDLFREILPDYSEVMIDESYWLNPDSIEEKISLLVNKPVSEVMTADVRTAGPDTPLIKVGTMMKTHNIQQIPIVKESGQLAGVVTMSDITWGFMMKQCKFF